MASRRLIGTLSLVFVLAAAVALALVTGVGSAANGPADCGALNMLHDATMATTPMARDNSNGNTGMSTAVANSCR